MSAHDIPPTPTQESDPPFLASPSHDSLAAEKPTYGSYWRYIGVFVLGVVVGWFVFGWYLFPLKTTDVYPTQLRPDIADEYLIMAAESYAATHDLRRAAKRLRYWEPEELANRIHTLAISLEKIEPERSSYLNILAQDLHLKPSAPGVAPSQPAGSGLKMTYVIIGLVLLLILIIVIILAQRKGLVAKRQASFEPEPALSPAPMPVASVEEDDAIFSESPLPGESSYGQTEEEIPPWETEPSQAPSAGIAERFEITPLPDRESIWNSEHANGKMPDFGAQFKTTPSDLLFDEAADDETAEDFEHPIDAPEDFTTVPSPPPADINKTTAVATEKEDGEEIVTASNEGVRSQTLQFDGAPDFNVIVPIEIDHDFGQFVLGVAITAPHNSSQVVALEALLYDRNDIRTVSILLAPPPLANDPDLLAQYWEGEKEIAPLQPGATFHLETAYLAVDATVRQVALGPRTSEGVPIIESAEIEFSARRSGEGL